MRIHYYSAIVRIRIVCTHSRCIMWFLSIASVILSFSMYNSHQFKVKHIFVASSSFWKLHFSQRWWLLEGDALVAWFRSITRARGTSKLGKYVRKNGRTDGRKRKTRQRLVLLLLCCCTHVQDEELPFELAVVGSTSTTHMHWMAVSAF